MRGEPRDNRGDMLKRHRVFAGMCLITIGLLVVWATIYNGRSYAGFMFGKEVAGEVIGLPNNVIGYYWYQLRYEVKARWIDPAGKRHVRSIYARKGVYQKLKPGDKVTLLIRADDPSKAILAAQYPNRFIALLFGILALAIIFLGIGMAVIGFKWVMSRWADKDPALFHRGSGL